jgi:hypothetical protein
MIELLSIPFSPSADTTSPTQWSSLDNIPVRNVIEQDVVQDHYGKSYLSFSLAERNVFIKSSSLLSNFIYWCVLLQMSNTVFHLTA